MKIVGLLAAVLLFMSFLITPVMGEPEALPAAGGAGEVSAAGPAATGLRVLPGDLLSPDFDTDVLRSGTAPATVRIVGARNGTFSAKVVVTSDMPIRGLTAQLGDLKGGAGAIPSSSVRVRYVLPWGEYLVRRPAERGDVRFGRRPGYLGLLADGAPAEYPRRKLTGSRNLPATDQGPLAPLWLTVTVPSNAAAETYSGTLAIQADGQQALTVPVELKVMDWAVPAARQWRTWIELIQSPDTLALEYGVEPWSERHWELIARSMRLMGELGNRIVYVPLIARTNLGNAESMVRWVTKPGGGYEHDFAIMDRYLDTAEREMGKPAIVVFYVWENYMIRKGEAADGAAAAHEQERILNIFDQQDLYLGKGPAVTVVANGRRLPEAEYLPHYTEAASKALWQPPVADLMKRLAGRGLEKSMMLGTINDCWPTAAEVRFWQDVAPGVPWVLHAHFGRDKVYDVGTVGYRAQVWHLEEAERTSLLGWRRPDLMARFYRVSEFGDAPLVAWRYWAEFCITGNQRGVGRLGADFWPVIKDRRGVRQARVWERYPESNWRNLGIYTSLLAPGADGPVATPRFEVLREGVQECEARIAIESILTDEALRQKLDGDLVRRCREALDERIARMRENPGNRMGYTWNLSTGWQGRGETLYALAGEVERRIGAESRPTPAGGSNAN